VRRLEDCLILPEHLLTFGFIAARNGRPVNQLPAFLTDGMYRRYLHPGEIVVVLSGRGDAGMLFQADADFYFRIAGGYINASLTPVNALPRPVTLLARPSPAAIRKFDRYARSSGLGAIIVEQAWAAPWMELGKLGLRGITAGGVTIYPMGPWLYPPGGRPPYSPVRPAAPRDSTGSRPPKVPGTVGKL
jgi:hypothetical protein